MKALFGISWLALVISSAGCRASLGFSWVPPSELVPAKAAEYPDAPAVYLLRQRRILLNADPGSGAHYTQEQTHDVISILREPGLSYANVRVRYDEGSSVIAFAARTRSSDGSIVELNPSKVRDEESAKVGKERVRAKVFALPSARVGSVIEVQYTIQHKGMTAFWDGWVRAEIPIKTYRIHIYANEYVRGEAKLYNSDSPWRLWPGKLFRFSWEARDLPAYNRVAYQPDRHEWDLWWAFRMTHMLDKRGVGHEWYTTWETTLQSTAASLLLRQVEYEKGLSLGVDQAECATSRCRIERALEIVRDHLVWTSQGTLPGRKAREVVESGWATTFEKARLLHILLARADVPSRFGLLNRRHTRTTDDEFPSPRVLQHVVLRLDADGETIWIDPSCDYCRLGEVPAPVQGVEALLLEATKDPLLGRQTTKVERDTVKGAAPRPDRVLRRYELNLGPDGSATVTAQIELHGDSAQRSRSATRKWQDKDWRESTERTASRMAPNFEVSRSPPTRYELEDGRSMREWQLELRGYVVEDGDRWLVPLTALSDAWDDDFKAETRALPFVFEEDSDEEDVLRFEVPAGFELESLPPPQSASGVFGTFKAQASQEGRWIELRSRLELRAGEYDEVEYPSLKAAFDSYRAFRRAFVVLRRR